MDRKILNEFFVLLEGGYGIKITLTNNEKVHLKPGWDIFISPQIQGTDHTGKEKTIFLNEIVGKPVKWEPNKN